MKFVKLMVMAVVVVAFLAGCGAAPQEDAVASEGAQVAGPTPVSSNDFESGEVAGSDEATGWSEEDQVQDDQESAEDAPAESVPAE